MKHRIEKPSEQIMRFFTPDLYVRFNSQDDDEADHANEEWERQLAAYQNHLAGMRNKMSSPVRKLAEQCLHDAELLVRTEEVAPLAPSLETFGTFPFWSAVAILSVKRDNQGTSLIYLLWDRVRESAGPEDWPFSKKQKHWLFDELDAYEDGRNMFVHRVLFSDGSVVEIPLVSVMIHDFPLQSAAERDSN